MADCPRILAERYALTTDCKRGGMSRVYRAVDLQNNATQVAVKLFDQDLVELPILQESFRRETSALQELKHPNIVVLHDFGLDIATGHPYIVLEWVEKNLFERREHIASTGWDSFYEDIGKPILEAISYAHSRNYIHRDIKPQNILLHEDNTPKLADFGISKLRKYLMNGLTLADHSTIPFSPPERDLGRYSFTIDVFGFGVLVLWALSDIDISTYQDIEKAISELDVPAEIGHVIEKSVSLDPLCRQQNAGILQSEIEHIQAQRRKGWKPRRKCFIVLTNKAYREIDSTYRCESHEEAKLIIMEDLSGEYGIRQLVANGNRMPGHYNIYGATNAYHFLIDELTRYSLTLVKTWRMQAALLERERDKGWNAPFDFSFEVPRNLDKAKEAILALELGVDEYEAEVERTQLAEREMYLFSAWNNFLRARLDIEQTREKDISYDGFRIDGNRIIFSCGSVHEGSLLNQVRRVSLKDGSSLTGEIDDVGEHTITLYIEEGDASLLPIKGSLMFDIRAAKTALDRQKNALDAVRYSRSVRADLKDIIIHPSSVGEPLPVGDVEFFQAELDEAKRHAVRLCLGAPSLSVIEGPPGTGKTTFIAELVLQYIARNPKSRILLCSQTHVALDNAIERIQKVNPILRMIRVGRATDTRIDPNVKEFLIDRQMQSWSKEVFEKGQNYLRKWAESHGIKKYDVELGVMLKKLQNTCNAINRIKYEIDDKNSKLANLVIEENKVNETGIEYKVIRSSEEIEELKTDVAKLRADRADYERRIDEIRLQISSKGELEAELASLSEDNLAEWVRDLLPRNADTDAFLALLSINADWNDRFGKGYGFQAALIASSHLVTGTCVGIASIRGLENIEFDICIVDEASKATPTEILVPLSRSKKWVLVGDPRQLPPFIEDQLRDKEILQKYGLQEDVIRLTLLQHFLEAVPAGAKHILNIQHRMVQPIGDLISNCFYGGMLTSARKQWKQIPNSILPRAVTWVTTAKLKDRHEESVGTSYINTSEAKAIMTILERLNWYGKNIGSNFHISLLAAYAAQKNLLHRQTIDKLQEWEFLKIDCQTVDAYQGREADINIYSVTRSNEKNKLGFIRERERLNVALSRGRDLLIIVGDHVFCRNAHGENSFRAVVDYIEANENDCAIMEI